MVLFNLQSVKKEHEWLVLLANNCENATVRLAKWAEAGWVLCAIAEGELEIVHEGTLRARFAMMAFLNAE